MAWRNDNEKLKQTFLIKNSSGANFASEWSLRHVLTFIFFAISLDVVEYSHKIKDVHDSLINPYVLSPPHHTKPHTQKNKSF